jgi:murein DD-endopeptidase MepM/ murein hydrolase activator NlpD
MSTSTLSPEIDDNQIIFYGNQNYAWPIPGYTTISSYYGKRTAPTTGASTYHKGIDIPAPEGTSLIASYDGEITFTGFLGGGGYTITLTTLDNLKISYCHVSPNYIVSEGDQIKQGQIIGSVGPKYVYGVSGNTYKDSEGRPTNGATTGCHLHIGFRLDGDYVNPLDYLQ